MFSNYIHILNTNRAANRQLNDADKNNYIYSFLGLEGFRLFVSHPRANEQANSTHQEYKDAVSEIFNTHINQIRAHVDFFGKFQAKDETAASFLASLRSLATDSEFANQENKMLAIQLVNGCYNPQTRLKLLEH